MPLTRHIQRLFGAVTLLALALSPTQKGFALAGVNVTIADLLLAAAFGLALLTPGFFRRRPPAENVAFVALVAVSAFFGGNLRDGLKEWMQIALYFLVGERVMTTALEIWADPTARLAVGSGKSRSGSTSPTVRNDSLDCVAWSAAIQSAESSVVRRRHSSRTPL